MLEELDEAHSPDFIYREHNYYESRVYTKFAVKSRLNGQQHLEGHPGELRLQLFGDGVHEADQRAGGRALLLIDAAALGTLAVQAPVVLGDGDDLRLRVLREVLARCGVPRT